MGNWAMRTVILLAIVGLAVAQLSGDAATASEKYAFGHCAGCCYGVDAYALNYGHCKRRCQAHLAYPWNCNYYHTEWGSPVALVVPPTAEKQYSMGWGVGNTRLTRIYHQFGRPYPGAAAGGVGQPFQATPYWPSDTSQFGVYYVRGPW